MWASKFDGGVSNATKTKKIKKLTVQVNKNHEEI